MTSGARGEAAARVGPDAIPKRMQQAVLAIEDQSFYSHPGVNPLQRDSRRRRQRAEQQQAPVGAQHDHAAAGARCSSSPTSSTPSCRPASAAHVESSAEGARGPDVARPRAARVEGRDPRALPERRLPRPARLVRHPRRRRSRRASSSARTSPTSRISEAALIAGVIQSPGRHSPFANPKRRRRAPQRRAARDGGRGVHHPQVAATTPCREPLQVSARGVDNEAPYFVDMVGQEIADTFPVLTDAGEFRRRLHDARPQPAARRARRGARAASRAWTRCCRGESGTGTPRRRRSSPSTRGPARFSRWSAAAPTTSRSSTARIVARRQPGSVFKPFVYLAAFERAAEEGRHRPDARLARRATTPEVFTFDNQTWGAAQLRRLRRRDHAGVARSRCRAISAPFTSARRSGFDNGGRGLERGRRRHAAARAFRRSRSASSS